PLPDIELTVAPETPLVFKVKSLGSTPVTVSENVRLKTTCERLVGDELARVMDETKGATPSMTIFLLAPREFAAPGVAKVKVALFPAASLIVPEFSARDVVEV